MKKWPKKLKDGSTDDGMFINREVLVPTSQLRPIDSPIPRGEHFDVWCSEMLTQIEKLLESGIETDDDHQAENARVGIFKAKHFADKGDARSAALEFGVACVAYTELRLAVAYREPIRKKKNSDDAPRERKGKETSPVWRWVKALPDWKTVSPDKMWTRAKEAADKGKIPGLKSLPMEKESFLRKLREKRREVPDG